MSTAEAAFLFVTTWIKENGFCQLLCSDNDAGFCSEMMAIICRMFRMFGMKDQQFSGRRSHCNFVERVLSVNCKEGQGSQSKSKSRKSLF